MNYQWCDYLLDTKRYRLLRDGKQVDIEPQVFDLLNPNFVAVVVNEC